MFMKNDYPISEFDDNRDAKINPVMWVDKKFECNKMIITFFPEVLDRLIADGKIALEKTIDGENKGPDYSWNSRMSVLCRQSGFV